ncbi:MAG: iron ABC transporter permease [Oscillospiraceae bacterium]|nr:iron ABC transporter permease [Oscillospiraceae bacterium]
MEKKKGQLSHRIRAFCSKPSNLLLVFFFLVLFCLSVLPLLAMLSNMFTVHIGTEKKLLGQEVGSFTWNHFQRLFPISEWSKVNFWVPLKNSLIVAAGAGVLGIIIGGVVAWFITRSNMKYKKFISSVFLFPYMMPAWTLALFWVNLFQNSKVGGGNVGMVESIFGICMPEWFVFGLFPMIIVIALHYSPFAYLLIGGILKNMDATLEESATILKASRWKIIRRITLPMVMPAVLSTFLLIFSSGFSSYTVPVFLGSSVKMFTLSTKMRALINAGYQGQGYIIAFVSIALGCFILGLNQWFTGKRKSYTTVTGKSGQVSLVDLKKANTPISIFLCIYVLFFAIMPLISFALESVIRQPGNYSLSNMTLHFWIGTEASAYETGMIAGILLNPTMWQALGRQVLLALVVGLIVGTCGILIGYSCARTRGSRLSRLVESMAFFPYLMPAMAFGTIYLAVATSDQFKFLYGTFGVLVLVASIKFLPFASRSGINSMLQVSPEIEEAAMVVGVPWWKRMVRILFPIQKSSILSGYLLPVISVMREVALFTLLVPKPRYLLTTMLFSFNETGYSQYGSAVTLLIVLIVILINTLTNKLTGASLDKGIGG